MTEGRPFAQSFPEAPSAAEEKGADRSAVPDRDAGADAGVDDAAACARPGLRAQMRALLDDARAVLAARLDLLRADLGQRVRLAKQGAMLLGITAVLGLALVNALVIGGMFWLGGFIGLGWALLVTLIGLALVILFLAWAGLKLFASAFARPGGASPSGDEVARSVTPGEPDASRSASSTMAPSTMDDIGIS